MVRVAGGLVERPLGTAAVVSHPPREPTLGCTTPTSSTTPTSTSRTHCQEECGKLGLDTSRRKNFLRQPLMGDKNYRKKVDLKTKKDNVVILWRIVIKSPL